MDTVIEQKITFIKKSIHEATANNEYINPFMTLSVTKMYNRTLRRSIVEGFIPWDKRKSYKGCNASGTFNGHICEIVVPGMDLTLEHHNHLRNIIEKWSIIPRVLYVVDRKVISSIPYTVKEMPNENWVSASRTRNYILDDPLIDYLDYHKVHGPRGSQGAQGGTQESDNVTGTKRKADDTFQGHIMNNGIDFEDYILQQIRENVDVDDICSISNSNFNDSNHTSYSIVKYLETMNALYKGVPIIYQAVLWNDYNKTFGTADLLIKASMARQLFPTYSELTDGDIYQVYDIKGSSISILADGVSLNNDKTAQTYKAQIWVYVKALNKMLNQKVDTAYVIGRRYKTSKTADKAIEDNFDCNELAGCGQFNMIAKINFSKEKENTIKFRNAIKWNKEIRTNLNLNHNPPNDDRLYPNMKNRNQEYEVIKKDLAEQNSEITQIYRVGIKERKLALSKGISRADDPRLTLDILGMKNSDTNDLVRSVITVNSTDFPHDILFRELKDREEWDNPPIKIYLDIETINNTAYNLGHIRENFIYMIGIGIVIENKWNFKYFVANDLTTDSETTVLISFSRYMNTLAAKYGNIDIPIYHWSKYEQTYLMPLVSLSDKFVFNDMCEWVRECGICVKGAFDFKLKNYSRALHNLDLIDIEWPENISQGLEAMHLAYEAYNNNDGDILDDVLRYNEIDCKAMFEIHNLCVQME